MGILKWLDDYLEEFLLVLFLGCMTLIMGIQIFARYALGFSLSWSEEITRYLFIWTGFLSISYCTKKRISIKIDQLVSIFPNKGKILFRLVGHTAECIFFLYLIPFAWKYVYSAFQSGQLSPACSIPMSVIQAAPLICFILAAFRIMQRWVEEFLKLKK